MIHHSANGHSLDHSRNVVIFGGAGFIGSNWAEHLLRSTEAKVHIVDNLCRAGTQWNLAWLQAAFANSGRFKFTIGDVRDFGIVNKAVIGASEIYHFAAQVAVTTSVANPREDFEINLGGTLNILEAARANRYRPFLLFTSTNKVYGALSAEEIISESSGYSLRKPGGISEDQPLDFHSPYGCSKGAADQYVHDYARIYDLPTVVLRMSCIAGPRQFGTADQGWIAHFLYSTLRGAPLTIYGDGRQVRDVLHVKDLIHAFELLHTNSSTAAGNIYNIGGGDANKISLLELIGEIESILGERVPYAFAPSRAGDQLVYVTNFEKFERHTGWKPAYNVRDVLRDICDWYKSNQHLLKQSRIPLRPSAQTHAELTKVAQ